AAQRRGGRRATQLLDALGDVYELGLSDKEAGERRGVHPTQVTRARIDVLRFLQEHVTRHAG
ncbi:MAG TPA: hypothetical protein PKA64_12135, partial [Myxococcota bacterium]|nr:hypothetical protein [Myxococcota bacterium]